jgi:hypothetical protein
MALRTRTDIGKYACHFEGSKNAGSHEAIRAELEDLKPTTAGDPLLDERAEPVPVVQVARPRLAVVDVHCPTIAIRTTWPG